LELLVEADNPNVVLDSGFKALSSILDDEVEYWMKRLESEIIIEPDIELVIAKVRPKHGIKSLLINRLSRDKYPDKSLLLMQDLGGVRVLISARRQDFKVPMNDLMEKAIVGLVDATGGGHIPAAAASIRKEDEEQFLSNVKRLLGNELKRKA
jgi:c-di-AMP phosphodiesterase-like protein